MECLECGKQVEMLDNAHLIQCSGLTLQEYAFRHGLSLDILVPHDLLNQQESADNYPYCGAITRKAMTCLVALHQAGKLSGDNTFSYIAGEVRQVDQLLWLVQQLKPFGFQFRQEYIFNQTTHRVIALNRLKARCQNIPEINESLAADWDIGEWSFFTAILLATNSAFYGGYVFLTVNSGVIAELLRQEFMQNFSIRFQVLTSHDGQYLLRTLTQNDTTMLLRILQDQLKEIPGMKQHYYTPQPQALVAKQIPFDSAHFITDHPGKCANLHGGRYDLIVKVFDRINPHTGFVVDYGYLKAIVQREVIEQLDHKSLNLADPSLAWRSSTEHISMFIWERLIHYLPNLYELQIYETAQSYCCFKGPSLDDLQENGGKIGTSHFQEKQLGQSQLRRALHPDNEDENMPLRIVQGGDKS